VSGIFFFLNNVFAQWNCTKAAGTGGCLSVEVSDRMASWYEKWTACENISGRTVVTLLVEIRCRIQENRRNFGSSFWVLV
jgi:hypothetical protein